jgi:GMP synthase (glutamine-hydrolysing)
MIVIIDFGSQTAHLISRRISDFGIKTAIVDPQTAFAYVELNKPAGIVFSGGPASVYEKNAPTIDKRIFTLSIPILGICYGQQLTAHLLKGGKTLKDKRREDGPATLSIQTRSLLFSGLPATFQVWMSHGDTVIKAPEGFVFTAKTNTIGSASMENRISKIYCVQFHPEVAHTENGTQILKNFVEKICLLKVSTKKLSPRSILYSIQETVGDDRVIAAVSGGVDSSVAAALVAKAIGNRLTVVYIDNGLMRVGTREEVEHIFTNLIPADLRIISCRNVFLEKLRGVTDPEKKRKIIGSLYIDYFQKEAKKIRAVKFLMQGTIYSDVIESKGTKHAVVIKSHHNVGGLPKNMKLKLIEPLRYYYKDEVRMIGRRLQLPGSVINKQPFPGPGHAIRIIGEVTKERLEKQKLADSILLEEIKKSGLYKKVFQSFTVLTGANSTAVRGDGRFYDEVVALRIYDSEDIMSASWSRIDWNILQKIVSRITNEVPGVSRVVYDITTKPPATMEWE